MEGLFPNFLDIFNVAVTFVAHGGWVLFVLGLIYMLWRLYYVEIEHQYVHSQKWVFLNIKVPRENRVSLLGVETIFSQLHALQVNKTFYEHYVEGQIDLWYSFEIVSMGGKISFIVRVPAHTRDMVEAAIYSQYPQAEISETSDYMESFNYDPDHPGNYEIFGCEWKLNESDVIPIKTYKDFEHPSADEKIIDPLANFFEGLSKAKPHEFMAYQIITQPLSDEAWHPKGINKVKELTGEELEHKTTFWGALMSPFEKFAHFSYKEAILGGGHGHGHEDENKPRNNWLNMTEAEKERVALVERKIGKPGYKTKLRMLYITTKDKFDNSRKSLMCGLYRPLGSVMTNKIRPDVSKTWTGKDAVFSKPLEQPYLDYIIKNRKRYLFKGYKNRDIHLGLPMFILNIEELATLFHFPITSETTTVRPSIEQTLSKTSQPPANLPIGEL